MFILSKKIKLSIRYSHIVTSLLNMIISQFPEFYNHKSANFGVFSPIAFQYEI